MSHHKDHTVCKRCVLDSSISDITFNSEGCSYCEEYLTRKENYEIQNKFSENNLKNLIRRIKNSGKGKQYDCIVGVSGGVDSSWVLKKVIDFGLRPLAVHMDNGWNSELAQNNISNLVKTLNIDLYTHVIDWEEYRNLMQSFFDADVIDVELLYDNAMLAVNYNLASKFKIKYILGGTNQATEGMKMPSDWNWFKYDKKNIISISNKFSGQKLKTFPSIGITSFFLKEFVFKIKWISFLDYIDYRKNEALEELTNFYSYKPYPYKHYESIFTRFYQGHILLEKFNVDKRKLHLSTLVVNGFMSREDALKDLERIPYPSEIELNEDKEYFLKKMEWSLEELNLYLKRKRKEHDFYPSSKLYWDNLKKINNFMSDLLGKRFKFQPNR